MTVVKKDKKKRAANAKKEVEIPIILINKKSESNREVVSVEEMGSSGGDFKIIKDEDDLPVFQNKIYNAVPEAVSDDNFSEEEKISIGQSSDQKDVLVKNFERNRKTINTPPERVRKSASAVGEKKVKEIGLLNDPKRKETVLIASVVLIASLIFFAWLAILKNNLSFSLESQSPISLEEAGTVIDDFRESWEKINTEWSALQSDLEQKQKAEDLNQEVVDKLKEKVLTGGEEATADAEVKREE